MVTLNELYGYYMPVMSVALGPCVLMSDRVKHEHFLPCKRSLRRCELAQLPDQVKMLNVSNVSCLDG